MNNDTNNPIENVMAKTYNEQWFDIWVQNFSQNLHHIWEDSSSAILSSKQNPSSAIVIGRGPSLKKFNHLQLIAESNFKGNIVCCDGSLVDALKMGITPEKFPNFYVVSIDAAESISKYYDDPIIEQYGKKINGIFSTTIHPKTTIKSKKSGIKSHWLHPLIDYEEGKKSFNQIAALMVRAKNHPNGLPAIQTGGNVGTSSWFIAWKILNVSTVILTGIDHSWNENDSIEKIVTHGFEQPNKMEIDPNDEKFKRLFPLVYNPHFDCNCILDPIFQYYSSALKEFISRSPKWVNTINATQGGCIFGDRISCMSLQKVLEL